MCIELEKTSDHVLFIPNLWITYLVIKHGNLSRNLMMNHELHSTLFGMALKSPHEQFGFSYKFCYMVSISKLLGGLISKLVQLWVLFL
jgi:hypothetical protein